MNLTRAEAEAIGRTGVAALQRGDGSAAREIFERLVAGGHSSPSIHLLLAQACRLSGDAAGEERALDRTLAAEPHNIRGLLMRGDRYAQADQARAAASFYKAAIAAAATTQSISPSLATDLQRAEDYVRRAGSDYEQWLLRSMAEHGVEPGQVGARFGEAIEILFGRKQIYPQQPSIFYYPGLAQVQFFEREQFSWASDLEAATGDIRVELQALLAGGADFRPYVEAEKDRPHRDFHGMQGDPSWGAYYLWKDGSLVEENAARCPRTVEALSKVPMTRVGSRTPSVLFSLLQPGAHIPPHHGMLNCRLICHLPLVVPPGCWLRVGNETRSWEEGKLLIFDDSIEHEAKNGSSEVRVVLLFDIWRPELSEAERQGIWAIFEGIDRFQSGAGNA